MRCHANARLSPIGRRLLVDRIESGSWTVRAAAQAAGISERSARKWLARWRAEGELGLLDRSSAPSTVANRHRRGPDRVHRGVASVADDRPGDRRDARDGALDGLGDPDLDQHGQARAARARAGPALRARAARRADPRRRQEARTDRAASGHRITGPAGRGRRGYHAGKRPVDGWEFVHVAIDDATRLAYVEVLADEKAVTAIAFLRRAVAFFESHGMTVEARDDRQRLAPTARPSTRWPARRSGLKHLRTRPYRPQTNGKAERFIRTMLGGWAYGAIYRNSSRTRRSP